jgi:hypothetical protein
MTAWRAVLVRGKEKSGSGHGPYRLLIFHHPGHPTGISAGTTPLRDSAHNGSEEELFEPGRWKEKWSKQLRAEASAS